MKVSKKFLLAVPLFLVILTGCSSGGEDEQIVDAPVKTDSAAATVEVPNSFVSKEGDFSINFPGQPEVESSVVDGKNGSKVNMTLYTYDLDDNNAFLVASSDGSSAAIEEDGPRKVLKNEQSGQLSSFGAKTAYMEKESDYGKFPGLMYKIKTSDGFYVVAHTYIVESRMYQLEMISNIEPTDDQIKSFIGSFKLLK